MLQTLSQLFMNTTRTIQNWKKENRPVMQLIEMYFSEEELNEFLKHGKIKKFDIIRHYEYNELLKLINNEDTNLDFLYSNVTFKINSLSDFDKAVMFQSIKQYCPSNKLDLIKSIEKLKLTELALNKFLDSILFKKAEHRLDTIFAYTSNKNRAIEFLNHCVTDEEIEIFLKNPNFI